MDKITISTEGFNISIESLISPQNSQEISEEAFGINSLTGLRKQFDSVSDIFNDTDIKNCLKNVKSWMKEKGYTVPTVQEAKTKKYVYGKTTQITKTDKAEEKDFNDVNETLNKFGSFTTVDGLTLFVFKTECTKANLVPLTIAACAMGVGMGCIGIGMINKIKSFALQIAASTGIATAAGVGGGAIAMIPRWLRKSMDKTVFMAAVAYKDKDEVKYKLVFKTTLANASKNVK